MPDFVPVDHDPQFDDISAVAPSFIPVEHTPVFDALDQGAQIQRDRFGLELTPEGYPYYVGSPYAFPSENTGSQPQTQQTQQPQPTVSDATPSHFANVRYNNPGAMYPGSAASMYGSTGTATIGGGHLIADFPTPVHGAAANMQNIVNGGYVGLPIGQAIYKWSGGGRAQVPGFDPNQRITPEMTRDPSFMIPFMKAVASGEAPGRYPLTDEQWQQAYSWYAQGKPEGQAVGFDDSAFQAAAARTRQAVQPVGGRTPGLATRLLENYVPHVLSGMAALPQQATQAAGEFYRTGEYNPAPAVEAASLMVGVRSPFIKPGEVGATGGWMPGIRASERGVEPVAPAQPFYSAVERAIDVLPQPRAMPEQWLGMLRNAQGVKPEELQWLGLEDWLGRQQGPVTKQQIADFVRGNQVELKEVLKREPMPYKPSWDEIPGVAPSETKFGSYTLPGGENYREMLMTMPGKKPDALPADWTIRREPDNNHYVYNSEGQMVAGGTTPAEATSNALFEIQQGARRTEGRVTSEYRSPHWDEPNVLAHVRFNDRIIDGKKTLFLEEVQSDWHQAGKRQGYRTPEMPLKARKTADGYWEITRPDGAFVTNVVEPNFTEAQALSEARTRLERSDPSQISRQAGVPDAPFKTTWPELILKRMIRYAAENGYEKIGWTTGETQAARYDLSKQIKELHLGKTSGGIGLPPEGPFQEGTLVAYDHHGQQVINRYIRSPDELPDIVGKDVAEKLLAQPERSSTAAGMGARVRSLSGLDLKVGGEGMKGFYDRMLPAFANRIGKKYGAKVQTGEIPGEVALYDRGGNLLHQFNNVADAHEWERLHPVVGGGRTIKPVSTQPIHTIDITTQLRDTAIRKGFPLFAIGGGAMFVPVEHNPFAGEQRQQ